MERRRGKRLNRGRSMCKKKGSREYGRSRTKGDWTPSTRSSPGRRPYESREFRGALERYCATALKEIAEPEWRSVRVAEAEKKDACTRERRCTTELGFRSDVVCVVVVGGGAAAEANWGFPRRTWEKTPFAASGHEGSSLGRANSNTEIFPSSSSSASPPPLVPLTLN